jgi:hypothetical protein
MWSDAARRAALAARRRMHGAMKKTKFDRDSVAHALLTNRRHHRQMFPHASAAVRNLTVRRMTTQDLQSWGATNLKRSK